ncbi:uncharacterized protein LOC110467010 [Mizuhopecten yessoensis]|uniref:uncharacterized protein LOC110467010 n=1 Tax=Mizuhopecten yessoensis TaxID=6573 RepID=UPI000B45B1BD|nr:uncharacterized protein LOC110467010 [Mizuhopecten yessoensis]XP_021379544.1 uncharacterized protein LOC110467010 [Mizuhopecten yessoensis]XP_021379545.1 uncharacterized protein LOC110467010 [Mizuhopecten yessoensis]
MMDSTEDERMSVLLSKYLELAYTGTQEVVDIKRKAYLSKRHFESYELFSIFRAGSTAEGLNILGSDVDIMFIMKDVIVMYPDQCIPPNMAHKTILYARAADCRPGYVLLQLPLLQKRCYSRLLTNALVRIEDSMFVSSDIFREQFVSGIGKHTGVKVESNGPACTKDTTGEQQDIVFCFPCHGWPKEANEWIIRTRPYGWPHQTLIDNIVHHGCHLVPVGDKCSENTFLKWRISFATAERSLVHSFSHIQLKVYALLKYFLKQIKGILKETIGDDILCSYFLKTILFHAIENSNQLFWQEKNLFYCFWFCFKILIALVKAGFCPNYFIPANNLFKRKVHGQHQQILLDVLSNYHQMKWKCLSVGNFFKPIWEQLCNPSVQAQLVSPMTTQDIVFNQDELFLHCIQEIDVAIYAASLCILRSVRKAINSFSTSQSESDELFTFTYAMKYLQNLAEQQVYPEHKVATDNKTRYRSLRKCKRWMIPRASMGTELLRLATFHFLTGNYFKPLEMCKQVIKLASYYCYPKPVHPELKAMYCNSHEYHRFERIDRLKKMHIYLLIFSKKDLYLPHLCQEMLRTQRCVFIPPLPYALFLSFLCCHDLGDTTGRDEALRLLIVVQTDDEQGGHIYWTVHTLLGICYQTLGDNHRAIRAYWDSAKSQAEYQVWNPAIERIAVVYLCMYVS